MIINTLKGMGISLSYHTIGFILFFAGVLLIYFLMHAVIIRKIVLLAAGLLFYYYMAGRDALLIVIATSLIVYVGSFIMGVIYLRFERLTSELTKKEKRHILKRYRRKAGVSMFLTIALVLAVLIYVKVGGVMHFTVVDRITELKPGAMIVPLGLSYYTFSIVGYLLDIYWRKTKFTANYLDLILTITYFPRIVEGPISNYGHFLEQLRELPPFEYERVAFGMQRMIWGFFKKLIIADRLTMYTTTIFGHVADFAGIEIVIATILNAIAIYADFSGCMDIVIGASQVMGIELEENFRQPFFARTAAEFWRRWHITLGVWFKDYVYMPLSMSPFFSTLAVSVRKRKGNFAAQLAQGLVPLMVVWLLTGVWHGTGSDYIVWGIYWGVLISLGMIFSPVAKGINHLFGVREGSIGHRLFQGLRTCFLFAIGRLLTATGSLDGFFVSVQQIGKEFRIWTLFDGSLYTHGLDQKDWYVAFAGIVILLIVDLMHENGIEIRKSIARQSLILRWAIYLGSIAAILIFGIYGAGYDATSFAYGAF